MVGLVYSEYLEMALLNHSVALEWLDVGSYNFVLKALLVEVKPVDSGNSVLLALEQVYFESWKTVFMVPLWCLKRVDSDSWNIVLVLAQVGSGNWVQSRQKLQA